MNLADGCILLIVVVSAFVGVWRGFVREALSVLTWVAAFIVASLFYPGLDKLLEAHIQAPNIRLAVAFGLLFIATLFVGALLGRLVAELVRVTGLTGTDRTLGVVFGLIRGLILVVVLVALGQQMFQHDSWWQASALIPSFVAVQQWLWALSGQVLALLMNAAGQGAGS